MYNAITNVAKNAWKTISLIVKIILAITAMANISRSCNSDKNNYQFVKKQYLNPDFFQSKKVYSLYDALHQSFDVTAIDLSNQNLKTIPKNILKLQKLEYINLSNNQIEEININIDDNTFPHLSHLIISNNKLACIPKEIYSLNSLEYLDLKNNLIDSIPKIGTFGLFKNLLFLDLSNNFIDEINAHKIVNLPNLELNLSHNHIKNLSSFLLRPLCFHKLNLSNNPINHLPLEFGENIFYTTILNISNTNLTNLPAKFASINCKSINLSNNNLKNLQNDFIHHYALETLIMNNCNLDSIPSCITHSKSLKKLEINGNKIDHIPSRLFELEKLEHFSVSNNEISKIRIDDIAMLKNLQTLIVKGNPIEQLKKGTGQIDEKGHYDLIQIRAFWKQRVHIYLLICSIIFFLPILICVGYLLKKI